ncbi:hypothetical protein B0H65DRAFT_446872 [Neurospora tetraspora]|uniref:Uncharacterized protein n=1 Tax=Neurospora tetraspora TaxID=94610 RepID=A0AAE0J0E9_9PEZI|nr:hypothetical protein B0H65DRAFT_446872 [Neurospora tetraspora]
MSFFEEGFSADSAAHPEPPTSFDSGNGSDFSWEDWFDWDAYDADNGAALEASQLTQGDTSTDNNHFDDKNGLGKDDVASFDDDIVMSLDNGTFPGLQPMDVDDSVDVGASKNGLHNSCLARPIEKASTLDNSNSHEKTGTNHDPKDYDVNLDKPNESFGSNFPLDQGLQDGSSHQWKSTLQMPSFPHVQKSVNSSAGNFGTKGSNGDLNHLAEFQKWVLGLDATTMLLRTAQEAIGKSSNASSGDSNAARFTAPYSNISQNKHYSVSSGCNGNPTPISPIPRASNGVNIPSYTGSFSPEFPAKVAFPTVPVERPVERPGLRAAIVSKKECDHKSTNKHGNVVKCKSLVQQPGTRKCFVHLGNKVGRDRRALIEWRHARGIYTCTSCCNSAVFIKRTLCKHCRDQDEDGKKRRAAAAKQKAEEEKAAEQGEAADTLATLADVASGGLGNTSSGTKPFEGAVALGKNHEEYRQVEEEMRAGMARESP